MRDYVLLTKAREGLLLLQGDFENNGEILLTDAKRLEVIGEALSEMDENIVALDAFVCTTCHKIEDIEESNQGENGLICPECQAEEGGIR